MPRQTAAVDRKSELNPQAKLFRSHFYKQPDFLSVFSGLTGFFPLYVRSRLNAPAECIYSIPYRLNEFVSILIHCEFRYGKPLRKFGSLGNLNAMNFCSQPKTCISLWLDGEGACN
jgi:hypothetical protein